MNIFTKHEGLDAPKISSQLGSRSLFRYLGLTAWAALAITFSQAQPSTQVSNIKLSPVSGSETSLLIEWTNGNGTGPGGRVVIISNAAGSFVPSNGSAQTVAGTAFPADGAGGDLDADASEIAAAVFSGTGSSVTVTNLAANTQYNIRIYEFNGSGATTTYSFLPANDNPISARYYTANATGVSGFAKPTGINSAYVQVWGGGAGGGGTNDPDDGAGGGGGGAYVAAPVSISAAGPFDVTVAAAVNGATTDAEGTNGEDSWFVSNATILAKGGIGGERSQTDGGDGGAGGLASASIVPSGSIKFNGGTGGKGRDDADGRGGPGGSSAGTGTLGAGVVGVNGPATFVSVTAPAAPIGAGQGGDGGLADNDGAIGRFPGGGGGGSGDNGGSGNQAGGNGAKGLVILSFSRPIPTVSLNTMSGNPVFRVVFSKPINTGTFIDTDVTLTGTAMGALSKVIAEIAPNDGTTFTVTVSGMTSSGTVIASLADGVVADTGGNTTVASNTGTTYNFILITGATVTPNAGNVIVGQTVTVTLTADGGQTGLVAGSPSTINGVNVVGSFSEIGAGSYSYTYTTANLDPTWMLNALPFSLSLSNGTFTSPQRTTFSGGSASATDLTRPVVNSRSVGTITPTGVTFTINLTETGTTYWEITTSATPPTAAQIKAGTGTGHVSNGNFAVGMASTDISQAIGGLSSSTAYFIYSVSEDGVTNQSTPVTSDSFTTLCAPPTMQATAAGMPFTSILSNSMTVNWVRGNGTGGVIVVARQASAVSFTPVSGMTYAGQINANFSLATDQGSGNKVVYRGSGTSVNVTGLSPSTTYHYSIFEWNTANDCYLTTSPLIQNQATIAVANEATLSNATGSATLSSLAISAGTAVDLFSFDVTDAGSDGADTRITQMIFRPGTGNDFADLTQLIATTGAQLVDDDGNGPAGTLTVAAATITFASIPSASGQLGDIPNGTAKRYTLRVFFNNPLNAAIRTTADEENLVLDLASGDVTTTASFSGMAASSVTSGSANGVVSVVATELRFVTGPVNTLLLVAMAPVTVEMTDVNGARDNGLDGTVVGITSTGALVTTPVDATFTDGFATYSTITHSATATARTLTTNSGSLANPVSATFNITASNNSVIDLDPAFVHPVDIDYDTHQESLNITAGGTSIEVARFRVRDVADGDGAPTILTQVSLDFGANFGIIRRVELYDASGTMALPGTEFNLATQTITFGGLNVVAPDNGTTTFSVRVSFRNLVTDNTQFSITVIAPVSTAANISSTFLTPTGAVTSTAGNNNRIEVTPVQYIFVVQPASTDVDAIMGPFPTVHAVDAFLNREQDPIVGMLDVLSTGSLLVTPQTEAFVAGIATFDNVIHNVSGSGLVLFTNGPLANTASNSFQIVAKSSNITENIAFPYPQNIPYNNFQNGVNITTVNSVAVAEFFINDGGNSFPDGDLAPTILTNLTLDLGPNYTFVRRIALYNGPSEIAGTEQAVSAQTVNFGGLTLQANDDMSLAFTVRVTFNALVTDRDQISFTVTSASSAAGNSRFTDPDAGGATTSLAFDNNRMQVTATRMAFIQQPTSTLNGVTMTPDVVVGAFDPLNSIDTDFAMSVDLTSNGVMVGSPQSATFVNGVGTYNSIVHSSNGIGLVLTTNSILTNVNSSTFNITSSAASDIVANGAFVYPINIPYQNHQESLNIQNTPTSLNVARFDIRDGGAGLNDPDLAPTVLSSLSLDLGTNFGFIRRIALYDAAGTTEIPGTEQAVGAQVVNFAGFSVTAFDNTATSFTVRVSFSTAVTDNQQFSFTITAAATTANISSTFAAPNAGGAVSSTTGDRNRIEVTATQIVFFQNLSSPLLAGISVSTQMGTPPVVRTVDGFSNIDRDYGTTLNLSAAIGISALTLAVDVAPPNGGVYTFPGTFNYTPQTGNGQLTVSILGLISAVSNPVTVIAGAATQIVAGAAAPATISSLNNSSPGVVVFNFDINDDRLPLAPTNNDGLPTMFNQLIITSAGFNTIGDWTQAIAGARLTDGTNNLDVTAAAVSNAPNSITFSGINPATLGFVADNATKSYSLRIYLNSSLGGLLPSTIDGLQFDFAIFSSNINPVANSTTFVATNTSSGNADVVSVIATQARFISPALPSSASLNTPFPNLIVEATDVNNNRDRGFTGVNSTVREVSNVTGALMANQPVVGTTQFGTGLDLGLLRFAANFQYTSGTNGDDVTLTVKAGPGPGTTCGVNGIICTSLAANSINLLSSFESSIVQDPTFSYPATIDYAYRQEAANIVVSGTSIEISRMLLVDGSRIGPPFTTGTEIDGIPNGDIDGASTVLTSLTLKITNPSNLRRIELYSGGAPIAGTEINVPAMYPAINGSTTDFDFPFTIPNLTALDDNQRDITVRASFRNTSPEVTDREPINVSVVAAGLATGSAFFNGGPGYIAGVDGGIGGVADAGTQSPPGVNIINVVATKFDFVAQPAPFAGISPQAVTAGTVEAHDQWGLLDTDYNVGAKATAPVTVNFSGSFVNGVLSLGSMTYAGQGDGTVTVIEDIPIPVLRSDMNNTVLGLPNVSVQCIHVDVVHVTTSIATGGVVTSTNLIGGTFNHIIFGITFESSYGVTTPSVAPILQSFVIDFSNPITGIILNTGSDFPKVYESPTTTYNALTATDVATFGGGASVTAGTQAILVNLGAGAYDLSTPGSQITYFLEVDIDANASGSSPTLQPSVNDSGFGLTDTNIVTNLGSAVSNVAGQTYSFAAIFPPVLISSYPFTGQLNVDPNQATISLTFGVPVFSLDGEILLYDQTAGTPAVVCTLAGMLCCNGAYDDGGGPGSGTPLNTLVFNVPIALIPNHVYFVTIEPGNLTNLSGIMDDVNNTYPGFNYPGTLYFKAASPTPPILQTTPVSPTPPYLSNITLNGATINATYDQQGTTYYLVLKAGSPSPPPSNNQIRNPGTYPSPNFIAGSGSFQMVQTNPISQYGLIQPQATGLPGPIPPANQFLPNQLYEVWMFAENNALPTPFETIGPYGGAGSGFAAGGAGPTLTFTTPAVNPASIVSAPVVRVCNNSYQFINQPIVITEAGTAQFNTGGTQVSMNIGLPPGFQFDLSKTGAVYNYGTLTLVGGDFVGGSGILDFLGNSILRIRYASNGSATLDKIIISNLRVLATSSTSGTMYRVGGTALTSPIPDGTTMGNLTSFDAPIISFDNSYSEVALGNPPVSVTTIPDNADDLDPVTGTGTISLRPENPNPNDFGPNIFSGLGVNINILSLSAVTPDVPFNITITHSDNNGCISNNAVQYTIYDNRTGIKFSTPVPNPPSGSPPFSGVPPPAAFVQSPFCAINTNFVNTLNLVNPYNPPSLGTDLRYMAWNNLAGFYLRNTGPGATGNAVTARIPANAPPQIMSGPEWASVIASLPVAAGPAPNIPGGNPPTTQSYYFDLAHILNAPALFPGVIPDPYSNFRSPLTAQGNYYYNGGSLGLIEFTGIFQSTTNATVVVPRIQVVEIFVPPVPLVETSLANRTDLHTNDPLNMPGTGGINGPTNRGTNIYCQGGGIVEIFGYPQADPGNSVGTFRLYDHQSSAVIYDDGLGITPAGFVDNGNGTAVLNPNLPISGGGNAVRNLYRDIRIVYTFRDLAGPALCEQSAYQVIRITPNPVASFAVTTPLTPFVEDSFARCVNQPIQFNASSTVSGDATASVIDYSWDFGEVTSGTNIISFDSTTYPLPPPSATANPQHAYAAASGSGSPYQVKHMAISNWGCLSGPPGSDGVLAQNVFYTQNIDVGAIPVVKFKLEGVSTADAFKFNSNNQLVAFPAMGDFPAVNPAFSTAVSANDSIKSYVWDFGDGITTTINDDTGAPPYTDDTNFNRYVVTHMYASAGVRTIDLTVTSHLGCVNRLSDQGTYRSIVVLNRAILAPGSAYVQEFETNDGGWQVWGTGVTPAEIQNATATSSWQWGTWNMSDPGQRIAFPEEPLISKNNVWKTNLPSNPPLDSGFYNAFENSAVYSPSFDLINLTRPMISFNSVIQLASGDGVVLEYSLDNLNIADPNKTWYPLGIIGTGEDWYTDQGLAGRPGTQPTGDFGWSGSANRAWQAPKHVLDTMFNYPGLPPNKAVFRFALGSAASSVSLRGFTLDNVRIGDRTRTILLESFASTSNPDPAEKSENEYVAAFVGNIGTEVVKLNYHLNFPGHDPFNQDNPAAPSSRALFYNIVSTPRSVLDGEKDPQDRMVSVWGLPLYNLRTLQLAQADIAINPVVNADGSIDVTADITSRVLTGLQPNTVIHVVILEQNVPFGGLPASKQNMVQSGETFFEYVVKAMLPSAAGTPLGAVLPDGQTRSFGPYKWRPTASKLYPALNDLVVAVFVQESTAPYEVYQVELVEPINDPPVVTGVEPIEAETVLAYPNPANHELTVQLQGPLTKGADIKLIDQTGRTTLQASMPEGSDKKTLNVRDLAGGMYIMTIDMGQGTLTRKKVMIVHQD